MGTHRVRDGSRLSHLGHVYESGEEVDLRPEVAADHVVASLVEKIEPLPVSARKPEPRRRLTEEQE